MGDLLTSVASGALGFVGKFKLYLIAGAVGIATVFGAYEYGISRGVSQERAHEVVAAKTEGRDATQAIINEDNAESGQRAAVKVRDMVRERQLQAQVDALGSRNNDLLRQLDAKPDPTPDCHLSVGDLRMLNDAGTAAPASGGAQGVPDPAADAAYQEQAPSTVSCRAFVGTVIQLRTDYATLAGRHDQFVDWAQRELIDPQLPAATDSPK